MSYDNTGGLGADTWRHVAFIEQEPTSGRGMRWLMSSDVCKHCTLAACLEVCPTGALFRTEFGTVVVQEDVCNGCGYCVPACPFGVIDQRKEDGRAWKCTLCYDRLKDDMSPPARRRARRSRSSSATLDELARARRRRASPSCTGAGMVKARLYLADDDDGVGGAGRVLPAARRAGGLRPAARPGRHRRATSARCGAPRRAPARSLVGRARWRLGLRGPATMSDRDSYYGRPILKQPVWTWEIPFYFFFGGLAGASAHAGRGRRDRGRRGAGAARVGGRARLAWPSSPPLLISDLGRPARFLNMLRVFKPTSPMSVGSWILSAAGATIALGGRPARWLGRVPRLGQASHAAARRSGPALSTYTAVLVADTAIPVWHEARRELPFVFAAGSAMQRRRAAIVASPAARGPARRARARGRRRRARRRTTIMERRLGAHRRALPPGRGGQVRRSSPRGSRPRARSRWRPGAARARRRRGRRRADARRRAGRPAGRCSSAGRQSAADPKYVVEPQRARRAARA